MVFIGKFSCRLIIWVRFRWRQTRETPTLEPLPAGHCRSEQHKDRIFTQVVVSINL